MRNLIERIEQLWCENMHTETMWPIHGKYLCGTCLREYRVAFDDDAEAPSRGDELLSNLRLPA
jgi:hypothetical protein